MYSNRLILFFRSILFLSVFCFSSLRAQGNFKVGIIPSFNLPAKVSPRSGNIPIQSAWSPAWQWNFGFEYHRKKNALALAYQAGRTTAKFDNTISSLATQFLFTDKRIRYWDFSIVYISLQLSYSRLISEGFNTKIYVGAGVGYRYDVIRRTSKSITESNADTTAQVEYIKFRAKKFEPFASGEIVEEWTLKNKSRFRAGLEINYLPFASIRGSYTVLRNFSAESRGRFTVDGSFIGIKAEYVFRNKSDKSAIGKDAPLLN